MLTYESYGQTFIETFASDPSEKSDPYHTFWTEMYLRLHYTQIDINNRCLEYKNKRLFD